MSDDNVIQFKPNQLGTVEALREIANQIEAGEILPVTTGAMVLLDENGGLLMFSFGPQNSALSASQALRLGEFWLLNTLFFPQR